MTMACSVTRLLGVAILWIGFRTVVQGAQIPQESPKKRLKKMKVTEDPTINDDLHHHPPPLNDEMLASYSRSIGASVMGESALIDKETGRIFWEGGSTSTISASVAPMLGALGIRHVRATILSAIILMALFSMVARYIRDHVISSLDDIRQPLLAVLLIGRWLLNRVPNFSNNFLAVVVVLYLIEAYTCSTRRYLANALSSPEGVEEFIERLREEEPTVTWKVRCFHYERRWYAAMFLPDFWKQVLSSRSTEDDEEDDSLISSTTSPSLFTKKVVTRRAEATYSFGSCVDRTIAGMWKMAPASTGSTGNDSRESAAPFSKITLTKLLVLANTKARLDYFRQQSNFVTQSGQSDALAEFSTQISLPSFRTRRLLAVRQPPGGKVPMSSKLFRLHLFWVFTFLGLTVPYRIWFARHCDELRVTVAKETYADQAPSSGGSGAKSWFSVWTASGRGADDMSFRSMMRQLSLYGNDAVERNNEATSNSNRVKIKGKKMTPQLQPQELKDENASLSTTNETLPQD